MPPAASTRWCPTPEQLIILEDMYKGGIRTPNSSQIQKITSHLSLYGKIEGKNVFYWFQNHKARDRQKLRRKLYKQQQEQQQQQNQQIHHHLFDHIHTSCSTGFQQIPHYYSTQFLFQGRIEEEPAQVENNYYTWKMVFAEKDEVEKSTRTYGRDWMMMMDVGAATPCCYRPLKTLELFPITTTALKDECNPSNHFSFSKPTN